MTSIVVTHSIGKTIVVNSVTPAVIVVNRGLNYSSDEQIQDSIGSILVDTATIDLTYNDATPSITATVIDASISGAKIASSVALAGNPTTTTQSPGNNSTRIATTAFVTNAGASFVPYTGATTDVDLGTNNITAQQAAIGSGAEALGALYGIPVTMLTETTFTGGYGAESVPLFAGYNGIGYETYPLGMAFVVWPDLNEVSLGATNIGLSTNTLSINPEGGNVGIGKVGAAYKFDVYGTDNTLFNLTSNHGDATSLRIENSNSADAQWSWSVASDTNPAPASSVYYNYSTGKAPVIMMPSGDVFLSYNGGNVGVGLDIPTSPGSKLTVSGNTPQLLTVENTTGDTTNGFAVFRFKTPLSAWQMTLGADDNVDWVGKWYLYDEVAGIGRLVIDSAGHVGIGTNAPVDKVNIDDTNTDFLSIALRTQGHGDQIGWKGRIVAGGDYHAFIMGEYSVDGITHQAWLGGHNAALDLWTPLHINPDGDADLYLGDTSAGASPIMTIRNTDATVGIGTTIPAYELEVYGDIGLSGSIYFDSGSVTRFWHDASAKTFRINSGSIQQAVQGTIFTQTASITVANTVAETTITSTGWGTLTLPAGFLTNGRTLRITGRGYHSSTGSPTLILKVKLGSTVVSTTGAHTHHNATVGYFEFDVFVTCRTVGISGTMFSQGRMFDATDLVPMGTSATQVINTNITQAISATVQWGTAAAGNTITLTNFTVEVLN